MLVSLSLLLNIRFAPHAFAIKPVISEVVLWNRNGNVTLNVTVYHTPQSSVHYLDFIAVDIDGDIRTFPVSFKPETTFTVVCDLGPVEGTPMTTVQAHCNIDGYAASAYGPIQISEFWLSILLLMLLFATSFAMLVSRKIKPKMHR